MRRLIARRSIRVGLAASATAVGFALAASIGGAVSPAGTHASSHQYQYGKKVTICHRTGSKKNPFVTIRVSRSAVPAHLRHGDRLGPCKSVCHKGRSTKEAASTEPGVNRVRGAPGTCLSPGAERRSDPDRRDARISQAPGASGRQSPASCRGPLTL